MKLLIDIPDGYKDRYKSTTNGTIAAKMLLNCIANGTVLSDTNSFDYYSIYEDKTLSCGGGVYESLEEARSTIKEFREFSKEFEEFKDFCTPESVIVHVIEVKEIVDVNDEVDDVGKLTVKASPVNLPKKHGRLIDADSLLGTLRTYKIDDPGSDAEFERNRIVDFIIEDIAAETTILDAENYEE